MRLTRVNIRSVHGRPGTFVLRMPLRQEQPQEFAHPADRLLREPERCRNPQDNRRWTRWIATIESQFFERIEQLGRCQLGELAPVLGQGLVTVRPRRHHHEVTRSATRVVERRLELACTTQGARETCRLGGFGVRGEGEELSLLHHDRRARWNLREHEVLTVQ
ncbi:hypothetical protein HRbin27_00423 [bacterium HR27]|nr:hypothetical protein HRbin27_00423 [bacterium HR27]